MLTIKCNHPNRAKSPHKKLHPACRRLRCIWNFLKTRLTWAMSNLCRKAPICSSWACKSLQSFNTWWNTNTHLHQMKTSTKKSKRSNSLSLTSSLTIGFPLQKAWNSWRSRLQIYMKKHLKNMCRLVKLVALTSLNPTTTFFNWMQFIESNKNLERKRNQRPSFPLVNIAVIHQTKVMVYLIS